jgi:hypothetical protein
VNQPLTVEFDLLRQPLAGAPSQEDMAKERGSNND